MYKGKFDQKNKQASTDVQELLSQRSSAAAEKPASRKPAPSAQPAAKKEAPTRSTAPKAPAKNPTAMPPVRDTAKTPAARQPQPAKRPAPQPAKPQKQGPRLGGVIFYTLYFMFILVFFIATFVGLLWLRGWLTDYELAQPTTKAEQVFTQLFTDPDWDALYDASGVQDTAFEGKTEFVAYMNDKIGSSQLTYMETSTGLSQDKKYIVRLGSEKVASFTLVDKNNVGDTTLENISQLPDWQLGAVEVFFSRDYSYRVVKVNGHTAYVNDVPLDDAYTIQIATTIAENYLPEGTTGVSMCTQEVSGLVTLPTVTVFDDKGNQMEVTYDESTRTFTERTESNTISPEEQEAVLNAARTECKWMIAEITDRGTVAKYFDSSYTPYSNIVKTTELWMQSHMGYEFADESVTDYCRYTDELFSVRVSLTLNVTRTDGTVKQWPYVKSMFFHKSASGSWLCFEETNVDITTPVGKVRLTFMSGDTELTSNFYQTDASEIITPLTTIPDGMVFSGWATLSEDESGNTVYNLIFQPDSTGKVSIPESTTLEPMTLYAVFENADTAAAAPETTEGE